MIFLVQSIFRKIDERHVFDCEEKNLENIFASQFIFPDKKEKKNTHTLIATSSQTTVLAYHYLTIKPDVRNCKGVINTFKKTSLLLINMMGT